MFTAQKGIYINSGVSCKHKLGSDNMLSIMTSEKDFFYRNMATFKVMHAA
jgi:hypothetical protein